MCLGAEYTHTDRQINTVPQIDPQIYITGKHWTKTTPQTTKNPETPFLRVRNSLLQWIHHFKRIFFWLSVDSAMLEIASLEFPYWTNISMGIKINIYSCKFLLVNISFSVKLSRKSLWDLNVYIIWMLDSPLLLILTRERI